jgi:hypothetical protein
VTSLRDRRLRLAVVLLALLALTTGWLVVSRARADGTPPAERRAATAALPPASPAGSSAPSASATPGLLSATASGARGTAGSAAGRSREPLPARSGAKLDGGASLDDVVQDQGAGVPLPNGQTLWIFADTTQVTRDPRFFVTSSAGVTTRGSQKLRYASDGRGVPIEFLPRNPDELVGQRNGVRYNAVWPTGATRLPDGRIIIGYAKYDVQVPTQTFTFLGAGLYEYRYPGLAGLRKARPAKRISSLWSMADGAVGSPLYAGGHVYFTQCENLSCYSARTPVSGLTDRGSYTWFTGSGWSRDRADRKPMSYAESRPGRNPSTVFLPDQGVYGVVDTAAGAVSTTALLWVAPNPWGPWSKPARFTMPDCPASGCYTLNLHTGQSPPGAVRVSYATHGVGPHVRVSDVALSVTGKASAVTARPL